MKSSSQQAKNSNLTVPVIDLTKWRDGSEETRSVLINEVDKHLQAIGFLVVKNHGIPEEIRSKARQVAKEFFELDEQTKQQYAPPTSAYRGWIAQGLESNASSYGVSENGEAIVDIKEAFSVGPVFEGFENYQQAAPRWYADNIWPDKHIPGFKNAMVAWWHAADSLTRELLDILARALELDENWVAENCNYPMATITANIYPEMNHESGWRVGAHTDFGTITVLDRDKDNGLQIEMSPGEWQEAPHIENALIINLGSLMVNLSRQRWKANPHRVIARPHASKSLSLIFFHDPNFDTLVPVTNGETDSISAELFLQNKMDQIIRSDDA